MLYHKNVFWKKDFDVMSAELIKSVDRFSKHLQDYFDSENENRNFNANE